MLKNSILFIRRLDFTYFFGISLTIFFIIEKFISFKEILKISFYFFSCCIAYFLGSILMITKLKAKSLKVDNSLNEVSLVLYENAMFLSKKVGDYYIFKTRNFIMPNLTIFVKDNDVDCTILASIKEIDCIIESLGNSKKG